MGEITLYDTGDYVQNTLQLNDALLGGASDIKIATAATGTRLCENGHEAPAAEFMAIDEEGDIYVRCPACDSRIAPLVGAYYVTHTPGTGNALISAGLSKNVRLRGLGPRTTIIAWDPAVVPLNMGQDRYLIGTSPETDNLRISDLSLYGSWHDMLTWMNGVQFHTFNDYGSSNTCIDNVHISASLGDGIRLIGGINRATIANCLIWDTNRSGISIQGGEKIRILYTDVIPPIEDQALDVESYSAKDLLVFGCHLENGSTKSIYTLAPILTGGPSWFIANKIYGSVQLWNCENTWFVNNHVYSPGHRMVIYSKSGLHIVGNHLWLGNPNSGEEGALYATRNNGPIYVQDNWVYHDGNGPAIQINNSTEPVVERNRIEYVGTGLGRSGVELRWINYPLDLVRWAIANNNRSLNFRMGVRFTSYAPTMFKATIAALEATENTVVVDRDPTAVVTAAEVDVQAPVLSQYVERNRAINASVLPSVD